MRKGVLSANKPSWWPPPLVLPTLQTMTSFEDKDKMKLFDRFTQSLNLSPQRAPKTSTSTHKSRTVMATKAANKSRARSALQAKKYDAKREQHIANDTKRWEGLLKNWSGETLERNDRHVKQMCRRGVPTSVRGKVWVGLIGNELGIQQGEFEKFAEMGRELLDGDGNGGAGTQCINDCGGDEDGYDSSDDNKKEASHEHPDDTHTHKSKLTHIPIDIPRTFPHLAFFHNSGPWESKLRTVLAAFALYKPEVGYVQGMSYLAGVLLLMMEEGDAFVALCNLVGGKHYFPNGYTPQLLSPDGYDDVGFRGSGGGAPGRERRSSRRSQQSQPETEKEAFRREFRSNLPLLSNLFDQSDVQEEMYLVDWRLSLFCRILPLDIVVRIWDNFALLGSGYFIKVALGILKVLAPTLASQAGAEADIGPGAILGVLRGGFKPEAVFGRGGEQLFVSIDSIKLREGAPAGPDSCSLS